jgi:protein MBA1
VRITSRQSTTTTKIQKAGAQAEESVVSAKEQDCTEHFMLQHLRWNDQDKGWKIWGTVNPTTMEDAQNNPHFKPGLSALERIDMIKESMLKK